MRSQYQQWCQKVLIPSTERLLTKIKEEENNLQRQEAYERSHKAIEDLDNGEKSQIAFHTASLLLREHVRWNKDRIDGTLATLQDKYNREHEASEYGTATHGMTMEGIQLKEALHWLHLFWDQYKVDLGEDAMSTFLRDRRFLGGGSFQNWLETLTFGEALTHRLFTQHVRTKQRPIYQLMQRVGNNMTNKRDELQSMQRASGALAERQEALKEQYKHFGWLKVSEQLEKAIQTTDAGLGRGLRALQSASKLRDIIHWLQTEATSHLQKASDLLQPTFIFTSTDDEARQKEITQELWGKLTTEMDRIVAEREVSNRDEYIKFLAEEMKQMAEPEGDVEADTTAYLQRLKQIREDGGKQQVQKRLTMAREGCVKMTDYFLERSHRALLLPSTVDEIQAFQRTLLAQQEEKDAIEDDGDDDDLDGLVAVENNLMIMDGVVSMRMLIARLTQEVGAQRQRGLDQFLLLSDSRWRTTVVEASTTLRADLQQNDTFSQHLRVFWRRRTDVLQSATELNAVTQKQWADLSSPMTEAVDGIRASLTRSIAVRNSRRMEFLKLSITTHLVKGKTGDIQMEWVKQLIASLNPHLSKSTKELEERLQTLRERGEVDKDAASILRQQLHALQAVLQCESSAISYEYVDKFMLAAQSATDA